MDWRGRCLNSRQGNICVCRVNGTITRNTVHNSRRRSANKPCPRQWRGFKAIMLQRNLLYTAITRARKLCVLAGNPRAISMAVRNNKVAQRFTAWSGGWKGIEHMIIFCAEIF